MGPDVTPNEIRNAVFRTTLRGLDRSEVEAMLEAVAVRIEQLELERDKLQARAAESPSKDLESEFEEVGREVASILQVAREAAESMRERANLDAARWRREATEEAEMTRREAAIDAESLRRDAWVTGTELLEQAQEKAEDMRSSAERDVLTVMGEAEREAHRLTSGARREAEDRVRNANMEAEKITAEATARRNEIIDGANRQAAAAQERARALENRRDELLEELENVRGTLTRLEGSLEERREALDLSREPEPSVRVVHPPRDAEQNWEVGETVRVVKPEDRDSEPEPEPAPEPEPEPEQPLEDPGIGIADEVSEQVARIQETSHQSEPPLEASLESGEPVTEDEAEHSGPEPARPSEPSADTAETEPDSGLDALFASLRGGGDTVAQPGGEPKPQPPAEAAAADYGDDLGRTDGDGEDADEGTDWLAVRDSKLLPITNRALRGVKKAMTDVQNVALDSLRTDDGWEPDERAISEAVHAELVAVWSESFAVGHSVAEEMEGEKLKRPKTPRSDADRDFASDLAGAVSEALGRVGDGSRERQSAASRVFRVWRSDEAERRIRDIAVRAYEMGIEKSRRVATG
jgi:DivIVA domain-containing protein